MTIKIAICGIQIVCDEKVLGGLWDELKRADSPLVKQQLGSKNSKDELTHLAPGGTSVKPRND